MGSKSQLHPVQRRPSRSAILRRPPTGGWPLVRLKARLWGRQLLEQRWVFIGIFLFAATWCMLPQRLLLLPEMAAGSIADRTWVADRTLPVVDEDSTRALQARARQETPPVYDLDRRFESELQRQLAAIFIAGRELRERKADRESQLVDLRSRLAAAGGPKISELQLAALIDKGYPPELEERLSSVLGRLLRQGVIANKELLLEHRLRGITLRELPSGRESTELDLYRFLDYPDQVREQIDGSLNGWDSLKARDRRLWSELLLANVEPNLNFNSNATYELQERSALKVGSVTHTFNKGEVIVRKWSEIDELRSRALREMAGRRDPLVLAFSLLGTLMMAGAAVFLLQFACGHEKRADRSLGRLQSEILILLTLAIVSASFGAFVATTIGVAIEAGPFGAGSSYLFAIPFAALAMLGVLLYGRVLALVLSLVFSLVAGHLAGGEAVWTTMVYCLGSSLAAVFALDHAQFRQRSVMTQAGLVVAGINAAAVLTLRAMSGELEGGLAQLGFDVLCGVVGGLLSASIASFSVAVFETLFGITTSIKLIELANPNLPLLRRLAFEAPGTFQHSLAVANLAKAGVEAIDGDSVLVHTGALYHDIGKLYRPHYFVENQQPGHNPHDKIQPSMSALVLTNHVKEGAELAEKYSLPAPILGAIEQHHGTRLIKFFWNRANERREAGSAEVPEEDYRYPGPKPQNKEMGVLMLADAVEAASRTLVEPNHQKLRNVVGQVFEDCLEDGQLDSTNLTLGDLKKVEEAFLRVMNNVHHRRIDYPGFDFNRPESGRYERRKAG